MNRSTIYSIKIWALIIGVCLFAPVIVKAQNSTWHIAKTRLTTPWTHKVKPGNVHSKYPRPQMVRDHWENLNGVWDYSIVSAFQGKPASWNGKILVPFPIESALSGVEKAVTPDQKIWYHRSFNIPETWNGKHILLHFGAIDWQSVIWVNGKKVGTHRGGYDAFTLDITSALKRGKAQNITISVWDPSDAGFQPHGKQSLHPRGIWYTASSGIWQTVWLEPVPPESIRKLKMTPNINDKTLTLNVESDNITNGYTIKAVAYDHGKPVGKVTGLAGKNLKLKLKNEKLWSPSHPFLYDLDVALLKNGRKIDQVKSYFGMREVRLGKDKNGYVRLLLNGKPLFEFGPLDQGFWPDGLYTAPTDEALKYDIQVTKDLGFNMIRKHVKVEPQRWYYYCDKMGMLVWQDMPSGDKHIRRNQPDIHRVAQSAYDYKVELKHLIDNHYNHPSIVTWVPFNEGWGQFQTKKIAQFVKNLDPTRFEDIPTGWNDRGVGDMMDIHSYPGPGMPKVENKRAAVLGEFGGQALVIRKHIWLNDFSKAPHHYKTSLSEVKLHNTYDNMMHALDSLKHKGLAAAVYTQTTDVEIEVNGLMTYDRKIIKFDKEKIKKLNQKVIND